MYRFRSHTSAWSPPQPLYSVLKNVNALFSRVSGSQTVATACAVSVAGQIPFVGLVVPHVVRAVVGPGHRALLPLSLLLGGVFLLGCDLLQGFRYSRPLPADEFAAYLRAHQPADGS